MKPGGPAFATPIDSGAEHECGLAKIPSFDGYRIEELKIEQPARLIKLGELKPEQTNLIRVLARTSRYGKLRGFDADQLGNVEANV